MNGRVFLSRPERGKNTKMCQVVFNELNRGRRWTTEARLRGGGRVGPDLERERERERDLSRIDTEKLSSFHSELVETNKRPFHAKELFKWKWIAERETEIFFVTLKNLCSDHIRILDTKFSHFFGPEFFFNRSYQRIIDHRPIQIFLTWMEIGNDFLLLQVENFLSPSWTAAGQKTNEGLIGRRLSRSSPFMSSHVRGWVRQSWGHCTTLASFDRAIWS